MYKKESQLNKDIQNLIKAHKGYVIKTIVTNRSGAHDMLVCLPDPEGIGRFCSLEGKKKTNKMSSLQLAHRNEVINAGGLALEVKSLADALQVVDWVKTKHKQVVSKQDRQIKKFSL